MTDRRPTLVVVEDDDHVRRALTRFLCSRGYGVRGFDSAEAWLAGICPADGAIIDINLPGMTGLELDERLRSEGRAIPTVFITAHDEPGTGAAGRVILQKPVEAQALLDAIEHALAARDGATYRGRPLVRIGMVEAIGIALVLAGVVAAWVLERRRRRRAEAAAREHEAERAIVSEAPVMIWRSGVDKGCDFFNPWWLTFTGRTLAQELGDGWAEGVHPDDLDACLASYAAAFDARVPFRLEYRLRRFDGEYRWVLDIGTPRYDSTGQFLGYIGCCFDITDRRQAEQALGEAHTEINRVSRLTALGEFAAALSHELRQPLTAIIMNARTTSVSARKDPARSRGHEGRPGRSRGRRPSRRGGDSAQP